jgi:hypothetical protein
LALANALLTREVMYTEDIQNLILDYPGTIDIDKLSLDKELFDHYSCLKEEVDKNLKVQVTAA